MKKSLMDNFIFLCIGCYILHKYSTMIYRLHENLMYVSFFDESSCYLCDWKFFHTSCTLALLNHGKPHILSLEVLAKHLLHLWHLNFSMWAFRWTTRACFDLKDLSYSVHLNVLTQYLTCSDRRFKCLKATPQMDQGIISTPSLAFEL